MAELTRIQGGVPQLDRAAEAAREQTGAVNNRPESGTSFSEMLRVRQGLAPGVSAPGSGSTTGEAVRFSAHAQTRLQSRQIALGEGHLDRLQGAVQRAAGKGARDALILMDD